MLEIVEIKVVFTDSVCVFKTVSMISKGVRFQTIILSMVFSYFDINIDA